MKCTIDSLKAAGISWIVTNILLLGATIYEVILKDSFGLTGILFFISQIVYWITYIYLHKKKSNSIK